MQYFVPAHSTHHCAPQLQLGLNLCKLRLRFQPGNIRLRPTDTFEPDAGFQEEVITHAV